MSNITEHALVILTGDKPEEGLENGDIGTIVHTYRDSDSYEVEFVTARGNTIAVLTLESEELRPARDSEVMHARTAAP